VIGPCSVVVGWGSKKKHFDLNAKVGVAHQAETTLNLRQVIIIIKKETKTTTHARWEAVTKIKSWKTKIIIMMIGVGFNKKVSLLTQ